MISAHNLKPNQTVYWEDPDNGLCSGPVTIKSIFLGARGNKITVTQLGENSEFEVLENELRVAPEPNEVWRTKSGNYVLIVEYPMTEIEGNIGFIWYDAIDNNMNFSPLRDQLVEKTDMTINDWGSMMSELTGS